LLFLFKDRLIQFTLYLYHIKNIAWQGPSTEKALTKIVSDNTYEVIQSPISLSVEVIDIDKLSYKRKEKKDRVKAGKTLLLLN
jgi:hypothetical protein